MKRFLPVALSALWLIPGWAADTCMPLQEIKTKLPEIQDALKDNNHVIQFKGGDYKVAPSAEAPAGPVQDFLNGNFEGYRIHRLAQREPGICKYKLHDDKMPAVAYLVFEKVE